MVLPPGIPTFQAPTTRIWTRLDNVFLSEDARHALITCDVAPETTTNGADHIPIATILNLSLVHTKPPIRYNFRLTDWKEFQKQLDEELKTIPQPQELTT
ncbi:hypothetical protein DFH05DRAFT_1398875 [Lentinula detonsa]|uniref:Endonuclease/exonuclease/phosphatase domain-containing protein n=1 Tax=Lentinula detonsa TaxID=2804962 RepID=A0A9W8NZN6_9AGAR|nr:hypothetical protein DFH05DRAFT_1398875 [Lentinula detonsa]